MKATRVETWGVSLGFVRPMMGGWLLMSSATGRIGWSWGYCGASAAFNKLDSMRYKEGLVHRAIAKATGANVHAVLVLAAYYRAACQAQDESEGSTEEPIARFDRRQSNIDKYEMLLDQFSSTGTWPQVEGRR